MLLFSLFAASAALRFPCSVLRTWIGSLWYSTAFCTPEGSQIKES